VAAIDVTRESVSQLNGNYPETKRAFPTGMPELENLSRRTSSGAHL